MHRIGIRTTSNNLHSEGDIGRRENQYERDSAGALYCPNTLVDVLLPALMARGETWIVSEVTYRRDEGGTACDLVIMPPEAFTPQPILLQPGMADVPFNPG